MSLYYEAMSGLAANPCLFSTIRAGRVELGTGELIEPLYDKAGQYCERIAHSLETFHTKEYPVNDLMCYLHWPDNPEMEAAIRNKIRSAHVAVEASGDILYAKLELDMASDLTVAEFEAFTEQVESQYRDGWGAQFELIDIPTENGAVYLRLWHDEISFFTGAVKTHYMQQGVSEQTIAKHYVPEKSSTIKKGFKQRKQAER